MRRKDYIIEVNKYVPYHNRFRVNHDDAASIWNEIASNTNCYWSSLPDHRDELYFFDKTTDDLVFIYERGGRFWYSKRDVGNVFKYNFNLKEESAIKHYIHHFAQGKLIITGAECFKHSSADLLNDCPDLLQAYLKCKKFSRKKITLNEAINRMHIYIASPKIIYRHTLIDNPLIK